ncbi:MAG: cytochrome c biogenesis protein CcsA [Bacteroidota bacterium]|nr:cytochrome c biogenesis protein CcsA [Bacteroidota bacterium]MDX5431614.1 cytochrome c biogenesis protein CcsA [Bacteroidota bacterium]MDX5470333.1 cytochrome c biogenesis protein CcsA [Bacteroidota bacterium]
MMEIASFNGEHLLIGNLGKISVYLSFAASLFTALAYGFATYRKEESEFWRKLGRLGFWIHGLAVISIFSTLFVIIQQHYFEYQYAYQHSSRELPLRYMVSCFWEGQEGSFLLWMFWHAVLGWILMYRAKEWESPVMTVISLSQVMLSTMLLGIEIAGAKIGSSPFVLLRDAQPGIFQLPFIQIRGVENYLSGIQDGNGLNPLLQNYWMVIHPPTLFLGFAAGIVPFAYAMAALMTGKVGEWVKPALSWTLFAVMILGTGIIMGAFWAYESLSFGGYWAWDPVENASLIPWLLLIGLSHTLIIYKKTGKALFISYILAIFGFILVLYATFLTRSGILGNTSVHAFTDLGMSGQLLLFLFFFIALPSYLALKTEWLKWTFVGLLLAGTGVAMFSGYVALVHVPLIAVALGMVFYAIYQWVPNASQADEELSSREFWMFIGALVFVISCFQIILNTSMPVWNNLFGLDNAPPVDVVAYYNQWQMPIAIIIGILIGFGQLFKYKKTDWKKFQLQLGVVALASAGVSLLFVALFGLRNPLLIIFLFSAAFAVVGNVVYWVSVLKGKMKVAGGSVGHIGFGLMLIGIISSGSGKHVISINQSGMVYSENFDETANREHILLPKNVPTLMGEYLATYTGDTTIGPDTYYSVRYQGFDRKSNSYTGEEFTLKPNAQINPKMGLVSNPDTRHYLTHDVFTHVSQVPDKESARKAPYEEFLTHEIKMGDTIRTHNGESVLMMVTPKADKEQMGLQDADHVLLAELKVMTPQDTVYAHPVFALQGDQSVSIPDELQDQGLRFKFTDIHTNPADFTQTTFVIETAEKPPVKDYIILKAIVFPYINFLWVGTIIMVVGFLLAIWEKVKRG